MSNFACPHCGVVLYDSPRGYVTGCEHFPADAIASECASFKHALSSNTQDAGDYQARECGVEIPLVHPAILDPRPA